MIWKYARNTKVNFEYMQNCIEYPNSQIVINVLENDLQHCLIYPRSMRRKKKKLSMNTLKTTKTNQLLFMEKIV